MNDIGRNSAYESLQVPVSKEWENFSQSGDNLTQDVSIAVSVRRYRCL